MVACCLTQLVSVVNAPFVTNSGPAVSSCPPVSIMPRGAPMILNLGEPINRITSPRSKSDPCIVRDTHRLPQPVIGRIEKDLPHKRWRHTSVGLASIRRTIRRERFVHGRIVSAQVGYDCH